MRVLIVLPGAIGDVVRALPLLGRLRRAWPAAHLGWSVEPPSAPLLAGHPWLDAVHVFDRRAGVRGLARHLREVRAGRYEIALDLGRGVKSAGIARASGARRRLGFARADAREGSWLLATEHLPIQGTRAPKLVQCWRFGDMLGLPHDAVSFGLAPTDAEGERAAALLAAAARPIVAASLGSTCPSRRWWPDRTAHVLDALARSRGTDSVLLGTPEDRAFAQAVTAAMRTPVVDLTGRTSLRELLAVLARVRLLVGPDSGALHLAAAVGVPVVSLWGATSPTRSAPWGSEAWVVQGRTPCAPCFLKHCPIERACMRQVGVAPVLRCAEDALAA
jgi:lipopolysaccharide heptosyltransferase II